MQRMIQPILLLATLAFVLAPAVTPPFMGYDPAIFPVVIERPAIQPAGYAFAIWGVIYLWLIAHAGFAAWKRRGDPAFLKPAQPLLIAVVLGTVWLAIALAAPITATVTILVMAGFALRAFLIADPDQDRWMLSAPLAMFAGWLTAAAAVSTGVIVAGHGLLSDSASAIAMLAIVLAVAIAVQSRRPAMPVYGATVVWAIVAVIAVNWGDNPTVAYAALAGAVVMAAATLSLFRR